MANETHNLPSTVEHHKNYTVVVKCIVAMAMHNMLRCSSTNKYDNKTSEYLNF